MELVWEEVHENERSVVARWRPCPWVANDPEHWTDVNSEPTSRPELITLPHSENRKFRWIWVGPWNKSNWLYAVTHKSALGTTH